MNDSFLIENQKKRQDYTLGRLFCFAMFCFWQMGFIYYMGPSLTINGRTPLPISMDNVATLIAVCYVLSILYMIFLPRYVVIGERVFTALALIFALALFLPLADAILKILIYLQIFCCCVMIGFETFVIVNYFSEHGAIRVLTAGYGVALGMIAVVQNDLMPITFPSFRVLTVLALVLLFLFFIRMPGNPTACPKYVERGSCLIVPKKMMAGTFLLVFIGSLMAVSGPSIVGEVKHGVSITYSIDAITSFLIYLLYKKLGLHPFKSISVCMGVGCVGFLLMFAATYIPWFSYIACGFIGIGMLACQMLPLYGLTLMKTYPSKYISPIIIGLALVAVLIQSSMVELFRNTPIMLFLVYTVIMVIFAIIYLQIAPYFVYTFDKKMTESQANKPNNMTDEIVIGAEQQLHQPVPILNTLTKRELEVTNLIASGYSNAEIAEALFISAHTVNDHTKKIYRKLDVHSRLELAALLNRKESR